MFFLSEERVLLPSQGEGWDGGGFTSRVIMSPALSTCLINSLLDSPATSKRSLQSSKLATVRRDAGRPSETPLQLKAPKSRTLKRCSSSRKSRSSRPRFSGMH